MLYLIILFWNVWRIKDCRLFRYFWFILLPTGTTDGADPDVTRIDQGAFGATPFFIFLSCQNQVACRHVFVVYICFILKIVGKDSIRFVLFRDIYGHLLLGALGCVDLLLGGVEERVKVRDQVVHVGGGGVGPLLVFFCLDTWFRAQLFFFGPESAFVVLE